MLQVHKCCLISSNKDVLRSILQHLDPGSAVRMSGVSMAWRDADSSHADYFFRDLSIKIGWWWVRAHTHTHTCTHARTP